MARYGPEHKEASRRRLVEAAGRRFKRDGFEASGISALVADAGLTNGAFYGHFASKDDLIASVVVEQLAAQVAYLESLPTGVASVEAYLREYLSPEHRDDRASGCPSAALVGEVGRCDLIAREAYTAGAQAMVEAIARHLDTGDQDAATQQALGLFTLLVAALQLARATADPDLSDRVLSAAYRNAMTLIASPPIPATHNNQEQP